MSMTNPIGIISMFWARPFTTAHLPLFGQVRKAGLDFIELLVPEGDELDLARAKAAAAEHGIAITLAARVNQTRDLASSDPAAHEAGIRYLEECCAVAEKLGAKLVGGPLFGAPLVFAGRAPAPVAEAERLARIDRVVDGLRRAARRAEAGGVVLAVEPLNRFETDFCITTENGIDLVQRVDHGAVGLMLDTFHMNMEDDSIPRAIERTGRRMVHFQANENHRGFLGSGHISWSDVARALVTVDYRGPITLEPFRRHERRLGVPLAQWRPPDPQSDADLAASVGPLRAALRFARGSAGPGGAP
jgi:D-psicose/D-tagatose/L-ribulose 3-epimerase